jgi:heptose-I-phosphate ethanolaminephosphotransferase
LLGSTAVLAVSGWTHRHGNETRFGRFLVLLTVVPFLALMGYQSFLRQVFGVAPDDGIVNSALFSTDFMEASEFVRQYLREILKHVGAAVAFVLLFGWLLQRQSARSAQGILNAPASGARNLGRLFAVVFLLLHRSPNLCRQDPLLYFPLRYSEWEQQVESVRQLQARMSQTFSDPHLTSLHCTVEGPRTVVFVLGESITRLNFFQAGYPRKTTPELDAMGDELTWFLDVLSCDAATVPVMEKILTPATRAEPNLWLTEPDILTMARRAGYKTFWLSTHSTDANGKASVFASHADHQVQANQGSSRGEGTYDEVILPALETALQDPAPRKFIVLHLLEAHPTYYNRYPKTFARFNDADDTVSRGLKAAGRAFWAIKTRNYYDNALLYADHVLKRSLELCRASGQPVAWLFVPDHGQDAAHYSNFSGHNPRVRSQYEILMIFWRSSSFPAPAIETGELSGRPYQTDLLDHTILGLMGISGDYYDPQHDILSKEFKPGLRSIRGQPYP